METFTKDPGEKLDYCADLSEDLGSDTIATSVWTVPTGLTGSGETNVGGKPAIFIAGGVDGSDYVLVNTATTAGGRVHETVFLIQVREKTTATAEAVTDAELIALIDAEIAANPSGITSYELPDGRKVTKMDLLRLLKARGIIDAKAQRASEGMFAKVRVGPASG